MSEPSRGNDIANIVFLQCWCRSGIATVSSVGRAAVRRLEQASLSVVWHCRKFRRRCHFLKQFRTLQTLLENLLPPWIRKASTYVFFLLPFYNYIIPSGFLSWKIHVALPKDSQLRQIRGAQPTVHTGCFRVSVIHRALTWSTGSLTWICELFGCVYTRGLGL